MPKSVNKSTENLITGEAQLLVLLIGVNQYQDPNLNNLNFCANDCRELAAAIQTSTQLFAKKTILFHHDYADEENQPFLNRIRASLERLIAVAGKLDTILVYFSGHGILDRETKQPILCLTDTEKDSLLDTGLPVMELLERLTSSRAKYQLLFLDACHSGGLTLEKLVSQTQKKGVGQRAVSPVNSSVELIEMLQKRANQSQGFYALLSCDKNQESLEFRELGHGLFTYYLIEGFQGKAADGQGAIAADGLYKYVFHRTLEYIDKSNRHTKSINRQQRISGKPERKELPWQTPRRIVEGAGEFVLGLVGGESSGEVCRRALVVNALCDCEETLSLAGIFTSRGGFEVDYFPGRDIAGQDLSAAIGDCLGKAGVEVATAFLYFRAAMETTATGDSFLLLGDGVRLSRSALRKLLRNSKAQRVVIALDCPDAMKNAIAEWVEDLKLEGASLCLLAAAPPGENSTEFARALVRVLKEASPGFTVAEAIAQLQPKMRIQNSSPQNSSLETSSPPFQRGVGGDKTPNSPPPIHFYTWLSGPLIELLLPEGETGEIFDCGICPYMGLQAFRKKDAFYFHGRETIAQQILSRLQATSFLAVVGASGSGKSSVVQAGVLPQLEAGKQLPEKCSTVCLRPGKEPIKALALALASSEEEVEKIEGLLHLGVENFVFLLRQEEKPMLVLVIDQFEELFALAAESERLEFLGLLLGGLREIKDRLKLIITLRDDFIAPCLEVEELATLVQESHILVPPSLSEDEYRQAIVEPARKVGLKVESGLVDVLLAEVREAAGALPLLQFALRQLWECRSEATLSLQLYYERVGGLKGVLERKADEVLRELSDEERRCARWIFLSLVHLGEGRDDTRRRVLMSELFVDKYEREAMELVLQKLSEARLVVVGSETDTPHTSHTPEVSVEIAHEILIRHWSTLRCWLDESRGRLQLLRDIERRGKQWRLHGKDESYLPKGAELARAEEVYINDKGELSSQTQEFIEAGIGLREREEKGRRQLRQRTISGLVGGLVVVSVLAVGAVVQWRRAFIGERNAVVRGKIEVSELLADNSLEQQLKVLALGEELQNRWVNKENRVRGSVLLQQTFEFEQWKERNTLEGHLARVNNFSFSPDGSLIASASEDNTVRLWKPDGTHFGTLKGHLAKVNHVSFSPDGNLIASASLDNTVRLWKLDGTLDATLFGHQGGVNHVSFSPDGNLIASVSDDNTMRLWKLDGTPVATLFGHQKWVNQVSSTSDNSLTSELNQSRLRYVSFSPDGNLIASASDDGTVRLWKLDGTLAATLKGHQGWVNYVSFSQYGNLIATASDDYTVRLWKPDGTLVATLKGHQDWVNYVSFSPDGKLIASVSDDKTVRVWKSDVSDDKTVRVWKSDSVVTLEGGWVEQVTFSPDSSLIAGADGRIIRLWKPDGTTVATLKGHQEWIDHVSFSPDGNLIASASVDKTVRLWERDGIPVATLKGHLDDVNHISFSPNGNLLASVDGNFMVRPVEPDRMPLNHDATPLKPPETSSENAVDGVWEPNGALVPNPTVPILPSPDALPKPPFHPILPSPDALGKLPDPSFSKPPLSYSQNAFVRLWKLDGTLVAVLKGHLHDVNHVSFSADGNLIASASDDKTVRLWKPDGTTVATKEHQNLVLQVSFSPDGKLIASVDARGMVYLWKLDDTAVTILKRHPKDENKEDVKIPLQDENKGVVSGVVPRNTDLSFSLNGNLIASATGDKTVRLWKLDGTAVATLEGHQAPVNQVIFSPDGNLIASASGDNTVRLWKPDGTAVAILRGHQAPVNQVIFSPDGNLIASASGDNTARLWKPDGTAVATLEGHQDYVSHVSFSPDGKLIASASADKTVRLWNLDLDFQLKQGCDWVRDYLTNNPNVSQEEKQLCDLATDVVTDVTDGL